MHRHYSSSTDKKVFPQFKGLVETTTTFEQYLPKSIIYPKVACSK